MLDESFEQALRSADPFLQLRSLAEQVFAEGQSQEVVLACFESAREHLRETSREADEDTLTDVMDCLVGWCGVALKREQDCPTSGHDAVRHPNA